MDTMRQVFGTLMELDEAALLLDVSLTTIRRWCALRSGHRKLGHFKFGRRILISPTRHIDSLREVSRGKVGE